MLILALDTSGEVCSVCLSDAGQRRARIDFRHQRGLSSRLPAAVTYLLDTEGLALKDVDLFAVGLGPGSFTGVRVAVTTAKIWADILGRSLYGISSLDAAAEPLSTALPIGTPITAAVPARRGIVIAAAYAAVGVGSDFAGALSPPALFSVDEIRDSSLGSVLCGEAAPLIDVRIASLGPLTFASADAVARIAATRHAAGDPGDRPDRVTPLYVAPTPVG